jgi:YbbR domain-containing protein
MFRWIANNLRTFLWALALAIAVWVSAVTATDPDEVRTLPPPIPIEIVGQAPGLVITGSYPQQVDVTLRAPRSVWQHLDSASEDNVRAILDLSGLSAGQHRVDIQVQIAVRPVRIVSVTPEAVDLTLEPLISRTLPVDLTITGEPAVGYQAGDAKLNPTEVVVSGPTTLVDQVARARVNVNLAGARETFEQAINVQVLDDKNQALSGLTINPDQVNVSIPVIQRGGYRDMAVKVVVSGQVASGYRLANISVFPPAVTVFSSDPQLVNDLPGVVETLPLDLNGASEQITTRLGLDLPEGVSVVGEQTVLVEVGISSIQSSLTLSNKTVEITGLPSGLEAQIAPKTVDVILSGPLPLLDTLSPQDVRVVVDLTGLEAGTHQLTPKVDILVANISVESILPTTVEVVLGTPGSLTATQTPTPTPTPTPMP